MFKVATTSKLDTSTQASVFCMSSGEGTKVTDLLTIQTYSLETGLF